MSTSHYSVSNNQFKVGSKSDFGFYSEKNELVYFKGKDDLYSLKAETAVKISLEIENWKTDEYSWLQYSPGKKGKVSYTLHVSKANCLYTISDGNKSRIGKSDLNGFLKFGEKTDKNPAEVKIVLAGIISP